VEVETEEKHWSGAEQRVNRVSWLKELRAKMKSGPWEAAEKGLSTSFIGPAEEDAEKVGF
jgi:hypothetical protein